VKLGAVLLTTGSQEEPGPVSPLIFFSQSHDRISPISNDPSQCVKASASHLDTVTSTSLAIVEAARQGIIRWRGAHWPVGQARRRALLVVDWTAFREIRSGDTSTHVSMHQAPVRGPTNGRRDEVRFTAQRRSTADSWALAGSIARRKRPPEPLCLAPEAARTGQRRFASRLSKRAPAPPGRNSDCCFVHDAYAQVSSGVVVRTLGPEARIDAYKGTASSAARR
jgi:hypothetical protein